MNYQQIEHLTNTYITDHNKGLLTRTQLLYLVHRLDRMSSYVERSQSRSTRTHHDRV